MKMIFFIAFMSFASAAQATPGAGDVLRSVLASDFSGQAKGRIGIVLYAPGQKASPLDCDCGQDCGGVRCEIYFLSADELVIVDDRKILGGPKMLGSGEAQFKVRFRELAVTHGIGISLASHPAGREIEKLPKPLDAVVTYRLKDTPEGWEIFNPPAPRVSLAVMKHYFAMNNAEFPQMPDTPDKPVMKAWTLRQIAVLNSLH